MRVRTPAGAVTGAEAERWTQLANGVAAQGSGIPIEVDGRAAIAKSGALRRGRRFLLRRALTGEASPAESELRHLVWLRERLFRCPAPIAAVTRLRRGVAVAQTFLSARIDGARPLDVAWSEAGARASRARWAAELGREVGRMHALRFLHADLYARNVLVAPPPDAGPGIGRELAFIDAWAGGPDAWRGGRVSALERDLGCFFAEASDWMGAEHQVAVLEAYADARAANGRPVDPKGRWLGRAMRAREAELRRLRRAPARLRGRPMPDRAWPVAADWLADGARLRGAADRRGPRQLQ